MRFSLRRIVHPLIRAARGRLARVFRWLLVAIFVALGAAAYGLALWRVPLWMHARGSQGRYDARVLVVSVGGGVVVGLGLLYTARNYRLSRRGQVTDRFAQALERLGSNEIYVRIGGIYALEQVLRDSPSHHSDVLAVLKAFIRRRTPDWNGSQRNLPIDLDSQGKAGLPGRPEEDVQTALNALGRRPLRPERVIELSELYLAGARLTNFDLEVWDLSRANLSGAWFTGADLSGTWLIEADLSEARLSNADLSNAQCIGATLSNANLFNAKLYNTGFKGACLVGADLRDTNLCDADLEEADLSGAIIGLNPKWIPPGWRLDVETGRLGAANGPEDISSCRSLDGDSGVANIPAPRPGRRLSR
jgi:hypothetical protein